MNDNEMLDNYFYLTFLGEIIRIAVFSEIWVNIVTGATF